MHIVCAGGRKATLGRARYGHTMPRKCRLEAESGDRDQRNPPFLVFRHEARLVCVFFSSFWFLRTDHTKFEHGMTH